MNTESNKVLLLGIGGTGLTVAAKIERKKAFPELKACGIKKESDLKNLGENAIREAELVIIVADLGGKKENKVALQAAELAKEADKTVASFLTTPRLFEGEKAIMRALETAQEIGQITDSSLVINQETFNNPPEEGCSFAELINSLAAVDKTIADAIQNIMSLISGKSAIDIDLDDLKTTLAECGIFTIASGMGAGENRIEFAIDQALSKPLMKNCDISTARRVLIKFLAPKTSPVTMEEINAVSEFIKTLPPCADVKWGIGESDNDDILLVIILAAGFDVKLPE